MTDNERKVQEFVKRISNINKRQAEFLNECESRKFEALYICKDMEKTYDNNKPIVFDDEYNVTIDEDYLPEFRAFYDDIGIISMSSDKEITNARTYNVAAVCAYSNIRKNEVKLSPVLKDYLCDVGILIRAVSNLSTKTRIKNPKRLFNFLVEWLNEREDSIVGMIRNNTECINIVLSRHFSEVLKQVLEEENMSNQK